MALWPLVSHQTYLTLQSACICFPPLCTEEDPHLFSSCFWWNFRFVLGLSGISWLLLVGNSHKSRQQEVGANSWVPLLLMCIFLPFSILLYPVLSLVWNLCICPLWDTAVPASSAAMHCSTESLILGSIWTKETLVKRKQKRQLETIHASKQKIIWFFRLYQMSYIKHITWS